MTNKTITPVANLLEVINDGLRVAASPLDPGWKAALTSFNNGDFDTTAIVRVFNALPPRAATLNNVAAIVSAIYADTYWSLTFMDQSILSSHLVKALGVNQGDADAAASFALRTWRGMLVRGDTNDVGTPMPRGVLTASIDDIINGTDPIDPTIGLNQWTSAFFNQADGLKNFCYTRAQSINVAVPITQAKARMFFTDQGFNQPPQSWHEMLTSDTSALTAPMMTMTMDPDQPIHPTDRAICSDGFIFTPAGKGHYCLLAVVSTEFFTNDPLSSSGNWSSMQWISSNGAAGWHNVDVTSSAKASLKFYNQDPRPERFSVTAHCQNVPAGTKVSLLASGNTLGIEPQTITGIYQAVSAEGELPANYAGEVTINVETPNGNPLPANAVIEVQGRWILPKGHRDYAKAVAHFGAYRAAQADEPLDLPVGSVRFIGGE
jgi:hypothetical protein